MIQWPNIGLYGEFKQCEDGVLEAINSNFKILDTLVQMRILDFVTDLPNNPSPGDRYILEDSDYFYSGSGSVIAVWNEDDNEWEYITPQAGYLGFVLSTTGLYWFDGVNWVELPINPVQGPPSALNREVAVFDGTTGKWITGSGTFIDGQVFYGAESIYTGAIYVDEIFANGVYVDFNSDLNVNEHLSVRKTLDFYENDNNTSGSDQQIANPPTVITKFVNSGLNSIQGIANGDNKFLVLTNKTGNVLTIKHLSGTAGNQINTGIDGDLDLENDSSVIMYRDTTSNVWRVVGGTGAGGAGGGVSLNFRYINGAMGPSYSEGIPSFYTFSSSGERLSDQFKVSKNYKQGKTIAAVNGNFAIETTSTDDIRVKMTVRVFRDDNSYLTQIASEQRFVNIKGNGTAQDILTGDVILANNGEVNSIPVLPNDLINLDFEIVRDSPYYTGSVIYLDKSFELDFNYKVTP